MRKFTRKQKRMLRSMTAGLSCCALLSAVLTAAAVANARRTIPVRFSDIQEGAAVTAPASGEQDSPAQTQDSEYLYETLYPTELLTQKQTSPVRTADSEEEAVGAGGTLLFHTTEATQPPETQTEPETSVSSVPLPETTAPKTTKPETSVKKTTVASSRTPAATTAPPTAGTAEHTSNTPFTNIGGGVISDDDSIYITMLSLVNEARRENGLEELWYSARVHEVATLRAYELSSYYSHTRPNGTGFYTAFGEMGVSYQSAGENIAYGRNMFETPGEVFQAWMDSKSHRDNILNPDYKCVAFGLSVLKVGKDTYYYWSQEFAKF